MMLQDPEMASRFEQTFMEYDTFQDALEKPFGEFEMVSPRMSMKKLQTGEI